MCAPWCTCVVLSQVCRVRPLVYMCCVIAGFSCAPSGVHLLCYRRFLMLRPLVYICCVIAGFSCVTLSSVKRSTGASSFSSSSTQCVSQSSITANLIGLLTSCVSTDSLIGLLSYCLSTESLRLIEFLCMYGQNVGLLISHVSTDNLIGFLFRSALFILQRAPFY